MSVVFGQFFRPGSVWTTSVQSFCLLALALLSAPAVAADDAGAADDSPADNEAGPAVATISFERDIQPIFAKNCLGCHQPARARGEYVMTQFDSLLGGGETGEAAIVPGQPEASHLLSVITPVDGVAEMPQDAEPLHPTEIDLIRRWIAAGAENDSAAESGPVYTADNPPVYRRLPTITSLVASPKDDLLAVAGFHEVLLLSSQDGSIQGRLVGMSQRIESIRFSPTGDRLAAVGGQPGRGGEVQIWDVAARELLLSVPFTFDTLRGVSWSPDGSLVAFGATDNAIRAIDAVTGEQKLFQGAHEDWVLGTTFTGDGSHIVSVARDMTCKLTETSTERFIDNITSITPGALKGGLSSVVTLAGRDEILVGGADGTAQIYQVYRQSARKIGDNANLLRTLPTLPGRIFAVDAHAASKRLAAVATIDGKSEARVWNARPEDEIPADIQAIQKKQASDRSPEERAKSDAFFSPTVEQLAILNLDVPAYALSFLNNGELAVGGADGIVRIVGLDGQLLREFPIAPLAPAEQSEHPPVYDPARWQQSIAAQPAPTQNGPTQNGDIESLKIESLEVSPAGAIQFASPFEYVQLLVTATLADGSRVDVTRLVDYQPSENLVVAADGLVRPLAAGDGKIEIALAGHAATLPVQTAAFQTNQTPVDYVRDVNPVMSRLGCNQGTCHGAQKGKNGFRLSLRGYDPVFDLRALADDLAARRVNLASPGDSLMLLKALGRVPHEGGALIDAGSPYHGILQNWIDQGAEVDFSSQKATRIEISPENPVVQRAGANQQVRVIAFYADGRQRDVTREAYVDSGNTEVATASKTGLLTAVRRGEAPLLARYEGNYAASTLTVMGDRDEFQWQTVETYGPIDELVAQKWERMKILPSELCDDATFLRRVYLDLTGLPPTADEVRHFLADTSPTRAKRQALVDKLIGSPAFVDYWANKWADLLQVNSKFLGTEGATAFHNWIETAIAENRPYDEFAQQILTSTGSNKDNPPASYYKILRNPEDTMENTTHLFLGVRFNCNKCHDHPFERWTQDQYYETAAFFARTKLKADPASGDKRIGGSAVEGAKPLYEEVYDAEQGQISHPNTNQPVAAAFPYDCDFEVAEDASDRERLAAWITSADNRYFARSYVNRVWGYLLGVGLIEPIDDIRAGNPPTNPELLDYLTTQFIESEFNVQHLMRLICNSRTYQLSVATNRWNEDDQLNYSHATPRRLPAEVLFDTIHFVTGSKPTIPGVPAGTRANQLPDVGVKPSDGFLANLGRPVRESACECERSSDLQLGPVMALVGGPTVGSAIADTGNELTQIVNRLSDDAELVNELFLRIVNRPPSEPEVEAFLQMLQAIDQDHADLQQQLADREAWWIERLPELQQAQSDAVAEAKERLVALQAELAPQREQLAQQREARIAAAQAHLDSVQAKLGENISAWEQRLRESAEWFPLRPAQLSASNGATLRVQPDRAIVASGNKDKGTYEVVVETGLQQITGFRLEALPVADIPGGGPGFPQNGNFVLTEFEVFAQPLTGEGEAKLLKIASGNVSFAQSGFSAAAAFDGQTQDQGGWAVSPSGGTVHWATFQLAEPLNMPAGTRLTFKLHQYHNAAEHRLARFRLSATQASEPITLGLPESFASVLTIPAAERSEADTQPLLAHLNLTDPGLQDAQAKLAAARAAIPVDPRVTNLERQIAELGKPIEVDATLLRLRGDFEQSKAQLANRRLTAAEDLTWALINSPAFLFNH
ncbi:DUF1549 domain-containing protein [Planctomycetaceae bacterium SH139]